jgi:hypothetical protein
LPTTPFNEWLFVTTAPGTGLKVVISTGRIETNDPTIFKIVDGQLLLFHSSPEQDGRKRWEESLVNTGITEKELLRRAKSNFIDLKF